MESVWMKPLLADEIINNEAIFQKTQSVVSDIMSGRIDVTKLVENMAGVLTNKEAENREKGMRFFTKILTELPNHYLTDKQIMFISKFYIDRLKDNHRVIPPVLEGYVTIIDMKNYNIKTCGEFFTVLFREVACQSQVRQDRYNIYLIIQKLLNRDLEYMKTLGPDFVYGFISSMDGERDPRNLLFLFNLLPTFISNIPLGHLVEEMFEVISCYYPVDFHPSPNDPAAVSRQDLADALVPCLCAIPEFGEQCLILLIEKLDSNLRQAKIDSLKLLTHSCQNFKPESYGPFLKTLWSSIHREVSHKTDDELRMAAHESLSALVKNLSKTANSDQAFENFIKGVLIAMQTSIAEATTVSQFVQVTKVLLTTANASKESCLIISKAMIPATVAYYNFKTSPKLQLASLDLLGDLYELAKHWEILNEITNQTVEIPQLCLTAVSQPEKEYQMAGFRNLMRVQDIISIDLVVPLVEVLVYNVQHAQDNDLLRISVETVHAIARKYPEQIMSLVVKGKCDLDNLLDDKVDLKKRLNLLCNLASINDFTKIIIEEMLKLITNDKEAFKVIEALNESMSNINLYSDKKVTQIESDHGLIDSIMNWLLKEINTGSESLFHGLMLISNTMGNLPEEKQINILAKHTGSLLEKSKNDEIYFLILESLYNSIRQSIYDSHFEEILTESLKLALSSQNETVRLKACGLIAHFLNKAEFGPNFELLYERLKNHLKSCNKDDQRMCPKLIYLYGWITKALIMRGCDSYSFWLQKILVALTSPEYSKLGSDSIKLIMSDFPDYLTVRQHCRVSLLYRQRMYQAFSNLTGKLDSLKVECNEAYLLSWAYLLEKAPKTILTKDVSKITPLVIDALCHDNAGLLRTMLDVATQFVSARLPPPADSLQTLLPRLLNLTTYPKSMDVRIKSLQCLYDIANNYPTVLLLPYKQDVLLQVAPSLDDKKRLVRNVAVRARTRWFLVGAPGEDKH